MSELRKQRGTKHPDPLIRRMLSTLQTAIDRPHEVDATGLRGLLLELLFAWLQVGPFLVWHHWALWRRRQWRTMVGARRCAEEPEVVGKGEGEGVGIRGDGKDPRPRVEYCRCFVRGRPRRSIDPPA